MKPNIVLVGMRGSGKSHVARILAERLQRPLHDTDRVTETRASKTIAEIVEHGGWQTFRDMESKTCRALGKKQGVIIATGGGVVVRPENIAALHTHGIIVFLDVPIAELVRRIRGKKPGQRPSLTGKPIEVELEEVWQEREALYREAADITIQCQTDLTDKHAAAARTAETILEHLREGEAAH